MPGRVRTRHDFTLLSTSGSRARSGPVRLVFVAGGDGDRWAYSIPTSVGPAVVRNRVRRRLRSVIDNLAERPRPGIYLIKCNFESAVSSYDELRDHLLRALERLDGKD